MTPKEIKKRIDENNKRIEMLFQPNSFTLNNIVKEILQENDMLQKQCNHEFENGWCNYCYKKEEK